jgi:hypothetical protein
MKQTDWTEAWTLARPFTMTVVDAPLPEARWVPGSREYIRCRDLALGEASGGRINVQHQRVVDASAPLAADWHVHDLDFQLLFVLRGTLRLETETGDVALLEPGDAACMPGLHRHKQELSTDMEVVEIISPGVLTTISGWDAELPGRVAGFDPERRITFSREGDEGWRPVEGTGFRVRDLGAAAATWGVVELELVRFADAGHGGALRSVFPTDADWMLVTDGSAHTLSSDGRSRQLGTMDAVCLIGRTEVSPRSNNFTMLQMRLPTANAVAGAEEV